MEEITEYPQANPAKRSHRRAWTLALAALVAAGLIVAAAFIVPPVVAAANQAAANTAYVKAQAEVPAAPVGDDTTGSEQQTLAQSDSDGAEAIAAERAAEAAAALAAQQAAAAAQQAADQAAAHKSADSGSNPGGLPAGAVPPDVPGTDQPDSTACASSALTWNGTESVCA